MTDYRFPSPGVDARFPGGGVDNYFDNGGRFVDGKDLRFEAPGLSTGGWSPDRWVIATQGNRIGDGSLGINGSKTRFGGRHLHRMGSVAPTAIAAHWATWRQAAANGTPEVAAANAVTYPKVSIDALGSDATTVLGTIPVTSSGGRSIVVSANVNEFLSDALAPVAATYLDLRAYFDLTAGQNAPYFTGTARPGASQTTRNSPANFSDQVDGHGSINLGGGADVVNCFMPSIIGKFSRNPGACMILGDSIASRQNDIGGPFNQPFGQGAGYLARAATLTGRPWMIAAVGGRTTTGLNSMTRLRELAQLAYGGVALVSLGSNDIAFATAGVPITPSQLLSDMRTALAWLRAAGIARVIWSTVPPRSADNNFKCTDLANQSPYATQATVAGGASRDGYGFGAGETRDQWNDMLRNLSLGDLNPDAVFDADMIWRDPVETSKWRVPALSATLSADTLVSATSISLSAQPPAMSTLVVEPGLANVDGRFVPYTISGAGPYTASGAYLDPYSASQVDFALSKAHLAGVTVKATYSYDGTHPEPALHADAAPALAAILGEP